MNPHPQDAPLPPDAVASFASFAREHTAEPLYARLATLVVARPARAALLAAAPPTQRKPVLWFAALHDRLLELAEGGSPLPPHATGLAAYYASLGGERAPDDALPEALAAFVQAEAAALRERIATRATQTNEVNRCAVLWPALAAIAQAHGGRPLALFDFGCSAGLNLLVDGMRVRFTEGDPPAERASVGPDTPGAPRLQTQLLEGVSPVLTPWRLVARLGVDPSPVALGDPVALRWLRACLWPSERERAARFDAAVALARRAPPPVRQADDALAVLDGWLGGLPADAVPVLFNSWVLAYFDDAALAAHVARVHALVCERGVAWLSAEDEARTRATTGLALPPRPHGIHGTPTWWALTTRGAGGTPQSRRLACSHPHGQWLAWQGG